MNYNKIVIGKGLKAQLQKGYNVIRISDWAYDIYIKINDKEFSELEEILRYIFTMEAGPEFVYTEIELYAIADKLINNEEISFPFKMCKVRDKGHDIQ